MRGVYILDNSCVPASCMDAWWGCLRQGYFLSCVSVIGGTSRCPGRHFGHVLLPFGCAMAERSCSGSGFPCPHPGWLSTAVLTSLSVFTKSTVSSSWKFPAHGRCGDLRLSGVGHFLYSPPVLTLIQQEVKPDSRTANP